MNGKHLGKIERIRLGYWDGMYGLQIGLSSTGGSCMSYVPSAETMDKIKTLLLDSNSTWLDELPGKPIELEFEGNALKTWRILKEVI